MENIKLNRNSSYYLQLQKIIEKSIDVGTLKPGEMIPSEKKLSERYEVSRITVRRAISELIKNNILETRAGVGSFVKDNNLLASNKTILIVSAYSPNILNNDEYFKDIILGIKNSLKVGYELKITKKNELRDNYISSNIDGIILLGIEDNFNFSALRSLTENFVSIGYPIKDAVIGQVCMDSEAASYNATKHFISCGHKRIGFINSMTNHPDFRSRVIGYKKALADSGLPFCKSLIYAGDAWTNGGYIAMKKILKLESRPTAVLASTYDLARAAILALDEEEISEEKMRIISFGGIKQPYFEGNIDLFPEKMGGEGMEMMFDLIENKILATKKIVIPTELKVK